MTRDTTGQWKKFLNEEELKTIENLCSGNPTFEKMRSRAISRRNKQDENGEPYQREKFVSAKSALLDFGYSEDKVEKIISEYPENKTFDRFEIERLRKYGTLDADVINIRIEHKLMLQRQAFKDPVKVNDVINKKKYKSKNEKIRLALLNY